MSKPIKIIKNILLIIIILVVSFIFIMGMYFYINSIPERQCLKQNGIWECRGGQTESECTKTSYCILPTTDKGKPCNDNTQCQGDCIPYNTSIDTCAVRDLYAKDCIPAEGKCDGYDSQLGGGCTSSVKDGKIVVSLCF